MNGLGAWIDSWSVMIIRIIEGRSAYCPQSEKLTWGSRLQFYTPRIKNRLSIIFKLGLETFLFITALCLNSIWDYLFIFICTALHPNSLFILLFNLPYFRLYFSYFLLCLFTVCFFSKHLLCHVSHFELPCWGKVPYKQSWKNNRKQLW